MPGEADLLFGKLAIKQGFIDDPQLVEALRIQKDLAEVGIEKSLADILLERGFMSPEKVEMVRQAQNYTRTKEEDRLYGEIAVRYGFCTVADIQEALAVQQAAIAAKAPQIPRLGQILRERGKVTDEQHNAIKKEQARQGKPLHLLESSVPRQVSVTTTARPPIPAKCPVCGEPSKAGAAKCITCGSAFSTPKGKASDVALVEMLRSSAEDEENLFGNIAVRLGFVSELQIDECFAIQRSLAAKGIKKRLGDIMVGKSYLSPMQVQRIVHEQRSSQSELKLETERLKGAAQPILVPEKGLPPSQSLPKGGGGQQAQTVRKVTPELSFVECFRDKSKMLSYALILGGLVSLVAIGYGAFTLFSGRAPDSREQKETRIDPAEQARKADNAFREVERLESSDHTTPDIREVIAKYWHVAETYPDTLSGKKAAARHDELTRVLEAAQKEFAKAQSEVADACDRKDYEKAIAIMEAHIARVSTMSCKPLLQESERLFDAIVAQARETFNDRLAGVRLALAEGKVETAVKEMAVLQTSRLLAISSECAALFEQLSREVEAARKKRELEIAAVEAETRRRQEMQQQVSTLLETARREASEFKFAEALLNYKKAALCAGGGPATSDALEGAAKVETLLKKTHKDLLTALNFVRNWTVAKQYGKASEKCKEIVTNKAFHSFHEVFNSFADELVELEKKKGDHASLLKKYEETQKSINEWAANQVQISLALQCKTCQGVGKNDCGDCAGAGTVKEGPCTGCDGSGLGVCAVCQGSGMAPCAFCKGHEVRCTACQGTGIRRDSYDEKKPCKPCRGKGVVKTKEKEGNGTCLTCGGEGVRPCKFCVSGPPPCSKCKGEKFASVACPTCAGKKSLHCKECFGSGLSPDALW